jgi:riboflavin synthase
MQHSREEPMFTGLVEKLAPVAEVREEPPGRRLLVQDQSLASETQIGDSISVSGCCLTVVAVEGDLLAFEAGPETLERTTLGSLVPGSEVNLERSLKLDDRLGGHFVTGHIDGVGILQRREDYGEWSTHWFGFPPAMAPQIASKGSIAVDGVSLTLVDVTADYFSVQLIPHTLAVTTLGKLAPGDRINLETDLLAKYVQKQFEAREPTESRVESPESRAQS